MKRLPPFLTILSLGVSAWAYADIKAEDEKDMQRVVREYLLENPEILYEMQDVLVKKEALAQKESLSDNLKMIAEDKNIPAIGNLDNPKVVLTEFMDYSCGYCRRMWPDLKKLVADNPELQIKIVNLPILGEDSQNLANYSLAFWQLYPEKWLDFHDKILTSKSRFSEEALEKLVESLGGDWKNLTKIKSNNEVIFNTLHQSVQIANAAGIQGTPFYALGTEEFFPGAVGYKQLDKAIKDYLDQ